MGLLVLGFRFTGQVLQISAQGFTPIQTNMEGAASGLGGDMRGRDLRLMA